MPTMASRKQQHLKKTRERYARTTRPIHRPTSARQSRPLNTSDRRSFLSDIRRRRVDTQFDYVSIPDRIKAAAIDTAVLVLFTACIEILFAIVYSITKIVTISLESTIYPWILGYCVYLTINHIVRNGVTVGQKRIGIRLVTRKNMPCTKTRSIIRSMLNIFFLLSGLFIIDWMFMTTKTHRSLHDRWSGAVPIKATPQRWDRWDLLTQTIRSHLHLLATAHKIPQ